MRLPVLKTLVFSVAVLAPLNLSAAESGFDQIIRPFVAKNCRSCHNGRSAAGGLNFETLNSPSTLAENRDEWEKIVRRISTGDMPPKSMPRPDPSDVKTVITWLQREFGRS